jgi:GNAT superfamily N-acetyltransferase
MNNPTAPSNIAIKSMTKQEIEESIQWAKIEGWNPGIHDAECFYRTDSNGFFAAKQDGELVGTISIVKYSNDFVFMGLFIVKPEFRGKGVGLAIQKFAMDKTRDLNLGLDGVLSMQAHYEKAGFKKAYNNTRYAGRINRALSSKCIPIKKNDLEEVADFDAKFFPVKRLKF